MRNRYGYKLLAFAALFALATGSCGALPTGNGGGVCPDGLQCTIIGPVVSVPFTTSYANPYYAPISAPTVLSTNNLAQVTAIVESNNVTATWLITCPEQPQEVGASTSQYFQTGEVPYVAGDACLARASPPLQSYIWVAATIDWSPTSLAVVQPYGGANDLASFVTTSLGYSPSVDGNVANGYSTNSNIFDQVPSNNQQGIWTWYAKYADLANAPSAGVSLSTQTIQGFQYQVTHNSNGKTWTCTYPYSVTLSATASNFANQQIPYYYSKGSFEANVLPYLLYDFNLSVPSEPANINLNMTYDVYGPLNYPDPFNNIDPFPIATGSDLFADDNSVLTPFYLNANDLYENLIGVNLIEPSDIIDAAYASTITSSGSASGSSSSGPPCQVTDLNCIAGVIHSNDGGSFMSEPQYAQYEIQGVQQLAVQYGFPWEWMYGLLMGQECQNCLYEVYPTGAASSPSSPSNCYNYWSYTLFNPIPPGTPTCSVPGLTVSLGSGTAYYNFNINNDPAASMQNANQQLLSYWVGKGGAPAGCTDFNSWVAAVVAKFNPGGNVNEYISSAEGTLVALFGKNWQQTIQASSTPSGSGCISQGPTSTISSVLPGTSYTFAFDAISLATAPNNYLYALTNSIGSQGQGAGQGLNACLANPGMLLGVPGGSSRRALSLGRHIAAGGGLRLLRARVMGCRSNRGCTA